MEAALKGSQGDRFHDTLHDLFAGRGFHPHAVHGGDSRAPVPGIRRDDQCGDPGFWLRLPDADAHAVQPLPRHAAGGTRLPVLDVSEKGFQRLLAGYEWGLGMVSPAPLRDWRSRVVIALTFWLFIAIPKGFLPSEDTAGSSPLPGQEGISFDDMVAHQKAVKRSSSEEPNVDDFFSCGGGGPGGGGNPAFSLQLKHAQGIWFDVDWIKDRLHIPSATVYPGKGRSRSSARGSPRFPESCVSSRTLRPSRSAAGSPRANTR